jgi:hypothetical protein
MSQILLGCAMLVASAFALWLAKPVGGKVQPWLTQEVAPFVAVAIVLTAGGGLVLMFIGFVAVAN